MNDDGKLWGDRGESAFWLGQHILQSLAVTCPSILFDCECMYLSFGSVHTLVSRLEDMESDCSLLFPQGGVFSKLGKENIDKKKRRAKVHALLTPVFTYEESWLKESKQNRKDRLRGLVRDLVCVLSLRPLLSTADEQRLLRETTDKEWSLAKKLAQKRSAPQQKGKGKGRKTI